MITITDCPYLVMIHGIFNGSRVLMFSQDGLNACQQAINYVREHSKTGHVKINRYR